MSRIRNTYGFDGVFSSSVYSRGLANKSKKLSYLFLNSAIFGPLITEERLDPGALLSILGSKYFGFWINIFFLFIFLAG